MPLQSFKLPPLIGMFFFSIFNGKCIFDANWRDRMKAFVQVNSLLNVTVGFPPNKQMFLFRVYTEFCSFQSTLSCLCIDTIP